MAGDSLLVMNSLLTKESMGGKVQMIYIDPPYGIRYGSNFQPFTNKRDVKDRSDADLTREPEMIKAFRDTWELGIHSYLTYLRDRLLLARELLSGSGSVFVQIGDENIHHVRELLDEIFGYDNFISLITFRKGMSLSSATISNNNDYLLWYAKSKPQAKIHAIFDERDLENDTSYSLVDPEYPAIPESKDGRKDPDKVFSTQPFHAAGFNASCMFPIQFRGAELPPPNQGWKTNAIGMDRATKANRLNPSGASVRYKVYLRDYPVQAISNNWFSFVGEFSKTYVVQTASRVVERCLLMTTEPGDLVLDPTCGSGTTAFVAEQWGRRWITCDTSRVAITLARQRLMTASFDYYTLRYPHEGLKGGFDYETVPHITLKSIANNPDIDTIHDQDHPRITAALADMNAALNATLTTPAKPPNRYSPAQGVRKGKPVEFGQGETLQEWEVPFELPDDWPDSARQPFGAFHAARQAMRRRMDQSIADHANQETLYDQPRIDKNKLRITGPFSVEAVPAPTVLSLDENHAPDKADASIARLGETSRQSMWRDELLNTGVRARGGALIEFAEFEILPDLKYIHATGSIADTGERVVVSFGPEHAALEQRQVELALTDAETLRPAPKFILFCAFTFDPEAARDIDEVNWPGVTLLKALMNTDLLTGDLKKKRASNQSFWLMGQPDVDLRKLNDGMWRVEVNGFDYFDPRKGDVVSGGKKQIAMWSLDTDYDQRSLMPHQVFFPMADAKGGWNRLKKTVRAELDEDLLEAFHGTVSLPFAAGDNNRIAVKIVDDRGIESLKIMPLDG